MTKELTDAEKLALGDEAKRMLESAATNGVISAILRDQLSALTKEELHSPKADTAHAVIRALDEFKNALRVLANDAVMIRKRLEKQG